MMKRPARIPELLQTFKLGDWNGFLLSTEYVQVGEGDDPTFILTPVCNDFLVWMASPRSFEVKTY